jgi:hypothetical protein
MATTTNYSWSTPDDTALVKDGAAAIRTLGSSVDTTVKNLNPETTLGDLAYRSSTANVKTRLGLGTAGQVLAVNSGATAPEWITPASGLTLVKTQTIGTAVSSVTVTSAFSSTYDNYLITVSGGVASATGALNLTLGSTATGYYGFEIYGGWGANTVFGVGSSNATSFVDAGGCTTDTLHSHITLFNPNAAKRTTIQANWINANTSSFAGWKNGYLDDSTQYTAFTLTSSSPTLTGGTIRVYGYQNS